MLSSSLIENDILHFFFFLNGNKKKFVFGGIKVPRVYPNQSQLVSTANNYDVGLYCKSRNIVLQLYRASVASYLKYFIIIDNGLKTG